MMSIFLNFAILSSARVFDSAYSILSLLPSHEVFERSKSVSFDNLKNENRRLIKENEKYKKNQEINKRKIIKAKSISRKISSRVARNLTLNVSSIVGESIPVLGIGAILSVTAIDLYDGCQTIKDTNELLLILEDKPNLARQYEVCGMQLPTLENITNMVLK